jgi:hypothetical protein
MNWPYVAAVLLISMTAIGFIVWQITAQVYRPWAYGVRVCCGWTSPLVIMWDAVCLLSLLALFWKIYSDAATELGEVDLCRPSIFGIRRIRWSEIVRVERVGFGYHISSKDKKIVVSPYVYRDPDSVMSILRTRIAGNKVDVIRSSAPY